MPGVIGKRGKNLPFSNSEFNLLSTDAMFPIFAIKPY